MSLSPAEEISLGDGARSEAVSMAPLVRLNRSGEGSQDLLSEAIVVGHDVEVAVMASLGSERRFCEGERLKGGRKRWKPA